MVSSLVRSPPDRADRVQPLAGDIVFVLGQESHKASLKLFTRPATHAERYSYTTFYIRIVLN